MEQQTVPFQRILFVCLNQRPAGETCCLASDSEPILEALKAQVKAAGLQGRVRVSRSGCQDLCAQGPNLMLFPDYRWFHHVTLEDVPRIVELLRAPHSETTGALAQGSGLKAVAQSLQPRAKVHFVRGADMTPSVAPPPDRLEYLRCCPGCGLRLAEDHCKRRCPRCGYFESCADLLT